MGKFALINSGDEKVRDDEREVDFAQMVFDVLITQLGYKPVDAKRMIAEALERNDSISTPEELFDEVYKGQMGQGL